MARRTRTLLRSLFGPRVSSFRGRESEPEPAAPPEGHVNLTEGTPLLADDLPKFRRLTNLLNKKAHSANRLLKRARRSIFPRSGAARSIYFQQAARVSSSSLGRIDSFMHSTINLLSGVQHDFRSSLYSESSEEPLERIIHPPRDAAGDTSVPTIRSPGKPILNSRKKTSIKHEGLHTAKAHTMANTSLNLLTSFKRSTLRTRASTGSLRSRMERRDISKPIPSEDKTWDNPASFGPAADVEVSQKVSRLRCFCRYNCTCRILDRYFINRNYATDLTAADLFPERSTPTVQFGHVDVYPIPPNDDNESTDSSVGDYEWLDAVEYQEDEVL